MVHFLKLPELVLRENRKLYPFVFSRQPEDVYKRQINDSVKFVTSRSGLPYIIVATAPSMDGYVADGAPIFSQGYKYSPVAHLTYGLVGDTDILKTAPQLSLIHI